MSNTDKEVKEDTSAETNRRLDFQQSDAPDEALEVFLRVKPLTDKNAKVGTKGEHVYNAITIESDTDVTTRAPPSSYACRRGETEAHFSFNGVFAPNSTQEEVYESVALPLVESFLGGRSALLFAYGCTNAGKTYTITGPTTDPGVVPRVFDTVFASVQHAAQLVENPEAELPEGAVRLDPGFKYAVWVSFLEIYNEQVLDLLCDQTEKREVLKLKEDRAGKVFAKGLTESLVKSSADGCAILATGLKNRQTAATKLNIDSSRSHSVLNLKLVAIPRGVGREELRRDNSLIQYSKLSIVDLAGSERTSRTAATGSRLKEAANINKSLTTFHRCVETLRYNQQRAQRTKNADSAPPTPGGGQRVVPFRDSQLTRLLQDFFVGGHRARMIVNVNPSSSVFDETAAVLKMSATAQQVKIESKTDTGRTPRRQVVPSSLSESLVHAYDEETETVVANEVLNELVEENDLLRERVLEMESLAVEVEAEVRAEVSAEMADRLAKMEDVYKERVVQEVEMVEQKFQRKLAIVQRLQKGKVLQDGEEKSEMRRAFDYLKEENKRVEAELEKATHALAEAKSAHARDMEKLEMKYKSSEADRKHLQTRLEMAESKQGDVAGALRVENEELRAEVQRLKESLEEQKKEIASSTHTVPMSPMPTDVSANILSPMGVEADADADMQGLDMDAVLDETVDEKESEKEKEEEKVSSATTGTTSVDAIMSKYRGGASTNQTAEKQSEVVASTTATSDTSDTASARARFEAAQSRPVFSRTYSKRRQMKIGAWTSGNGWDAVPAKDAKEAKKADTNTESAPKKKGGLLRRFTPKRGATRAANDAENSKNVESAQSGRKRNSNESGVDVSAAPTPKKSRLFAGTAASNAKVKQKTPARSAATNALRRLRGK